MAASQNSLQGSLFEGDSQPLTTKDQKAPSSKTSEENLTNKQLEEDAEIFLNVFLKMQ